MNRFFADSPEDMLEMLVGKEKLNAWRKKQYAKSRSTPPTPQKQNPVDTGKTSKSQETPSTSVKEGRDAFKKLFRPV